MKFFLRTELWCAAIERAPNARDLALWVGIVQFYFEHELLLPGRPMTGLLVTHSFAIVDLLFPTADRAHFWTPEVFTLGISDDVDSDDGDVGRDEPDAFS